MCGGGTHHDHRAADGEDEYVLDTATVRRFIEGVRARIEEAPDPEEATEAIRPAFARLLADLAAARVQGTGPRERYGGRHRAVAAVPLGGA